MYACGLVLWEVASRCNLAEAPAAQPYRLMVLLVHCRLKMGLDMALKLTHYSQPYTQVAALAIKICELLKDVNLIIDFQASL